jgi:alpha-D-xyloside xylohydrolase
MPLAFPDDPASWAFEEQYLLGPALFVAPVVREGGGVRFYLPRGRWYDLPDGEIVDGPRVVERSMALEAIPLYGRDGHMLPLGPVVQHTGELRPGVHIDELWAFGEPRFRVEWPEVAIAPSLERIPPGCRVRRFGR